MGVLPLVTTFFRTLQFVWALIGTIEFGKHTLNNSDIGGALDYQPLKTITGVSIAFLLLTVGIHAFGIFSSFTGVRQTSTLRMVRIIVECIDLTIWFAFVWIVWYLPKIPDIDADPENAQINDTLYWSNPWSIPTLMMNIVILGLVIAEVRHENKANGVSGVVHEIPLEHKGDFKSDVHTDVKAEQEHA